MNKTTERRLRLFEDARKYGAEILNAAGWICAVCRTYDQLHCFGRGKPKVKEGTNEIDPDLNLRDDEIDAKFGDDPEKAAELKKRRDGGGEHVDDGLGFDNQPFEAGWCVAGGNPIYPGSTLAWGPGLKPCESYEHGGTRYCPGQAPGEECPYLVFMELKSGRLYISNLSSSKWGALPLSGGWCVDDFSGELNGDADGGVVAKILDDEGFASAMQQAADASLKGMTGACEVDVAEAAKAEKERERKRAAAWSSRRSCAPGWGCAPSAPGESLYGFVEELVRVGCLGGDRLVLQKNRAFYPVACAAEGARSGVVLTSGGGRIDRSMKVNELWQYCRNRHITVSQARSRTVSARVDAAETSDFRVVRRVVRGRGFVVLACD